jgi:hypothetical protein
MVVRKIKSTLCDETTARQKLSTLMGNTHTTGGKNWDDDGTLPDVIASALSEFQVHDAHSRRNLKGVLIKDFLKRCTKSRPGIAAVYWKQGGGHAVVILGKDAGDQNLLVLDPAHNGVVSIPLGDLPRYDPPYNAQGFAGAGHFAPFLVTTA